MDYFTITTIKIQSFFSIPLQSGLAKRDHSHIFLVIPAFFCCHSRGSGNPESASVKGLKAEKFKNLDPRFREGDKKEVSFLTLRTSQVLRLILKLI